MWNHRRFKSIRHEMRQNECVGQQKTLRYPERRSDRDSETAGARDRKRQMGNIKSKLSNYLLVLYLSQIC